MPSNLETLRILIDTPKSGIDNMATDEAILKCVEDKRSPATLRFYQWQESTISLGYFQKHSDIFKQNLTIQNLPIVRRQTGGGAILHDDELTYSLILPLHHTNEDLDINDMYKTVHDAFLHNLLSLGIDAEYQTSTDRCNSQRGPFFCFSRKHCQDIIYQQQKLLGSAQRRTKNACLQHGSLILNQTHSEQPSSGVNHRSDIDFNLSDFIDKIITTLSKQLNVTPKKQTLNSDEEMIKNELVKKYHSEEWTQQR